MITQKTKKYHENMTRVFHTASSNHLENVRKHEENKAKSEDNEEEKTQEIHQEKPQGLDEE